MSSIKQHLTTILHCFFRLYLRKPTKKIIILTNACRYIITPIRVRYNGTKQKKKIKTKPILRNRSSRCKYLRRFKWKQSIPKRKKKSRSISRKKLMKHSCVDGFVKRNKNRTSKALIKVRINSIWLVLWLRDYFILLSRPKKKLLVLVRFLLWHTLKWRFDFQAYLTQKEVSINHI